MSTSLQFSQYINIVFLRSSSDIADAIIEFARAADRNALIEVHPSKIEFVSRRTVSFRYSLQNLLWLRPSESYPFGVEDAIVDEELCLHLNLLTTLPDMTWQAQQELLTEMHKRTTRGVIVCDWCNDIDTWVRAIGMHLFKGCCLAVIQQQIGVSSVVPTISSTLLPTIGFTLPYAPINTVTHQLKQLIVTHRTLVMNAMLKVFFIHHTSQHNDALTSSDHDFATMFDRLKQALILHHELLTARCEEASEVVCNLKLQISVLEKESREYIRKVSTAGTTINSLNTTDLIDLEIEGETRFHHPYKLTKLTPDFEFSLTTKYPVRDISYQIPPTSNWMDPDVESRAYGGTMFLHKLRNKKLQGASASVSLKGWKREIYARDIEAAQRTVELLTAKHRDVMAALKDYEVLCQSAVEHLDTSAEALQQCSRDISRMKNTHEWRWLQSSMTNALRSQSVLAVSEVLGLTSTIEVGDMGSTAFKAREEGLPQIVLLQRDMQNNLESLQLLRASFYRMRFLRTRPYTELHSIFSMSEVSAESIRQITEKQFRSGGIKASEDQQKEQIRAEALEDLQTLSGSRSSYLDDEKRLLSLLTDDKSEDFEKRRAKVRERILEITSLTRQESEAAEKTVNLLSKPTLPIGAFASLHFNQEVAGGCVDIWKHFCNKCYDAHSEAGD